MMKHFDFMIALAIVLSFQFIGCQQSDDISTKTNYTREQIVEQIIAYPDSRLDIWDQVSPENQYEIWVDKIDQILTQDLKPEWRPYFEELKSKFSYSEYLKGLNADGGLTFLGDWDLRFGMIATEDERNATIGSLYDYSSEAKGIDLHKVYKMKEAFDPEEESGIKITPREWGDPGHNQNCDCRWTNCDMTGQYCCKPWETTGCNQTTVGCGLLWLNACTHFCVDSYLWNCDDY